MKRKLLAAAAALVFSAGASAQLQVPFSGIATPGGFMQSWTFTFTTPSNLFGDVDSSGVTWNGATLAAPALSYSSTDTMPTDGFNFLNLANGTYTLTLSGSGPASGIGVYGGYFVTSPVPEPQTYALMLAGLSAVGFLAMRRRRAD